MIPPERLDRATFHKIGQLLAADTDDFNALVRLAGLDPARDFRHTDMSGTSMAGADLRGFDFTGADFRNVMLDGARIDGTCFKGADLSGTDLSPARGLETADCSFAVFQDVPFAPEMIVLPAGSFLMGSPEGEPGPTDGEVPQRPVRVVSFAIGRCPVTFAEYDYFCDATSRQKPDDRGRGRGRLPVICVSWDDAAMYVMWLSDQTGKTYHLPSEAEWEYACRAGTETAYWWGEAFEQKMTNTDDGGPGRTTEVGSYPANAWGLHDTLGNVWEWVEDHWHNNYQGAPSDSRAWVEAEAVDPSRVLRGGSWVLGLEMARSSSRTSEYPIRVDSDIGFRVACSFGFSPR